MVADAKQSQRSAVVLLSGGLDSMVSAAIAREQGFALFALTIDYNQRHRREIEAASKIAQQLEVRRHVVLPLDLSRFGGSALTSNKIDVPKDGVGPDIPVTYVPARNLVFLSLTLAMAEASGARDIARETLRLGLDPAVSWSCYDPTPAGLACGVCDSCRLRRKGFAEAGIEDGTQYAPGALSA